MNYRLGYYRPQMGKTRRCSERVVLWALENPGCKIGLLGESRDSVRQIQVEGPNGILAVSPPDFRPNWCPIAMMLEWPNGSIATFLCSRSLPSGHSANQPEVTNR